VKHAFFAAITGEKGVVLEQPRTSWFFIERSTTLMSQQVLEELAQRQYKADILSFAWVIQCA
jgi:hypothetical protein